MRFRYNLSTMLRRVAGRPTLRLGARSSLSSRARILNASRSSENIIVGNNSRVEGELFVFAHGGRIRIGDWCFVGPDTRIWSAASIIVGNRVLISHGCNVIDSLTHPINPEKRHRHFQAIMTGGHPIDVNLEEKSVVINDDAWVAAGATILRGVTIGEGAIVGSGALVTRDVAPRTIVAGNPAIVVRVLEDGEEGR